MTAKVAYGNSGTDDVVLVVELDDTVVGTEIVLELVVEEALEVDVEAEEE